MKIRPLLFLSFFLLATLSLQAQVGVCSYYPTDDAHCEGGTSGATNYGSDPSIRTKYGASTNSTYNRKSFVKFSLPGLKTANIASVKLRLYANFIQGSNFNIDLFRTDTTWSEKSINWNNAPVFGTLLGSFPCGTATSWTNVDLTKSCTEQGGFLNVLSFGLNASVLNTANQILWNSKESSANRPELVVVFKVNKPLRFSARITSDTTAELAWDTTGCNASRFIIERKTTLGSFVPLDTLAAGEKPLYVDGTMHSINSYTYRIIAENSGVNAEPVTAFVAGTSPMSYVASDCSQPMTDAVLPGATSAPILRLQIETENDTLPLKLTKLSMNVSGTSSNTDITSVNIYYTNSDSSYSNPVFFGSVTVTPPTGKFDIYGNQTLASGKNYFWITYSVSKTARTNNLLDAQCLSFTLSGNEERIPTTTAPAGCRTIDFLSSLINVGEETISATTPYANTNVVSFAHNVITSYKGYQYAAFWNETKQVAVARKKIAGGTWEVAVLSDYTSTNDLTDNHYNVSMGLCHTDGTFHLSYDHHAQNLNYRKSVPGLIENPENFQWTASNFLPNQEYLDGTTVVTQVTYPRFITKPNGDLLLDLRKGGSGNGDEYLWEYSGTTHNWTSIGRYINGISDSQNAYLHGIQYDKSGRLHASWCWREAPAPETNHDLYYTYSDDHGRNWKNTFGAIVGTAGSNPLRLATTGLKVWNIPQHRSLMNQESMCVDNNGRVHVLNGFIKDSEPDVAVWGTSYPVHFYRDDAGVWHRDFMLLEAKGNRDQIVCDANNNIYLILSNNIYMATEVSKWTDWKVVAQKGSDSQGDGAVDKERALYDNVLSIATGKPGNKLVEINYLIDNRSTGTGEGLTTEYFNSMDFQNKICSTSDSINLNLGDATPAGNVQADNFSVRYNGTLETRWAEIHTLYLTASEKVRCWINGNLMVDGWDNASTMEYKFYLPRLASHQNKILIEAAFTDKPPVLKLEWQSLRQPRSVVPIRSLYRGVSSNVSTSIQQVSVQGNIVDTYFDPSTERLFLNATGEVVKNATVEIFNTIGQRVATRNVSFSTEVKQEWDVSFLPKGMYLLRIHSRNSFEFGKIILN